MDVWLLRLRQAVTVVSQLTAALARVTSRSPSLSTSGTALRWSLSLILAATDVLGVCWLVFASPWALTIWWACRPWTLRS